MNDGMARPDITVFDPASSEEGAQVLDEAESAIARGRTISNEAIRKWLRSRGKATSCCLRSAANNLVRAGVE
jgi:hypothetical protein